MVCDRDPRLIASFFQEAFDQLGTKLALSTASHPQTDGSTERMSRLVEDILRAFVNCNMGRGQLKRTLVLTLEITKNPQKREDFPVYPELFWGGVHPVFYFFFFSFFKRIKSFWLHGELVKCKRR